MTPANLLAWALGSVVVAAAGATLPTAFRLFIPRFRLTHWRAVLLVMLAIPLFSLRGKAPVARFRLTADALLTTGNATAHYTRMVVPAIVAVAFLRLVWLAAGLLRLRAIRRRATYYAAATSAGSAAARILVSHEVQSPISFGFRSPVILAPSTWPDLATQLQQAVIVHETIHLRRRDWLFHLTEELLKSVFWFLPGVWFAIARIRLAREETVDAQAVSETRQPETYIRALLATVGAAAAYPAPAFATEHHLTKRIRTLTKEYTMSNKRAAFAFTGIALCLLAAGRTAVWSFPLQTNAPGPVYRIKDGVTAPVVLYKRQPSYTQDAKAAGIQGIVTLNVEVTPEGTAKNIVVAHGLDAGLDAEAVAAVQEWRFRPGTKEGEAVTVLATIEINFRLDK